MDPLFLNLGLQQGNSPIGSSMVNVVSATSTSLGQINGIPQESKLATYISNRQQLPTQRAINQPSASQMQLHALNQANHLSLAHSNMQTNLQNASLGVTKTLAALGLESTPNTKQSIPNLGDLGSISESLSHSASTPSFHSFGVAPNASSMVSSLAFPPINHSTSSSSPIRVHSPINNPSPVRVVNSSSTHKNSGINQHQNASTISTFQENVGGTTYFYTAQDINYATGDGSQGSVNPIIYPPFHVLPPAPSHIHHLVHPTESVYFFIGDELRKEILEKQTVALAQVNPEHFQDLPQEVDMYNELVPLEPPNSIHKSSMFGYATSAYKATHLKTGIQYCLYRIHGYRLSNTKVTQIVDVWKNVSHSNMIQLREVFTTKEFGDNSIVLVYDYYPSAQTLVAKHFIPTANTPSAWERLITSLSSGMQQSSSSNLIGANGSHRRGMLPEATLWNYIIQLTGAIRAIHTQGLACRTLDASKILLIDNKSRIRINCCGILDILNFDPNAANPLAGLQTYQQEDLMNLGKLIVSLSCTSYLALQRDNISSAIDLINRHYSRDLATLVVCLLTSQKVKSINDVMPIIGARFYTALESSTIRGDVYEAELSKELHNGRLFRLLTKLNSIVDRPLLNQDNCWSETADRFMLKLFRDYLFYQQTEDGLPWLDFGHITTVLNKLDVGSPDKVCLMSQNEQNVIVASFAEIKRCFDGSFQEIIQAMVPQNHL